MTEQEIREIVRAVLIETYPPRGMASIARSGPPALETIVREIVRAEMSGIRRDREARAEAAEHTVATFADRLRGKAHVDDLEALTERVEALESASIPSVDELSVAWAVGDYPAGQHAKRWENVRRLIAEKARHRG